MPSWFTFSNFAAAATIVGGLATLLWAGWYVLSLGHRITALDDRMSVQRKKDNKQTRKHLKGLREDVDEILGKTGRRLTPKEMSMVARRFRKLIASKRVDVLWTGTHREMLLASDFARAFGHASGFEGGAEALNQTQHSGPDVEVIAGIQMTEQIRETLRRVLFDLCLESSLPNPAAGVAWTPYHDDTGDVSLAFRLIVNRAPISRDSR